MRTFLRNIILWALAGASPVSHDPTDLDKYASENK